MSLLGVFCGSSTHTHTHTCTLPCTFFGPQTSFAWSISTWKLCLDSFKGSRSKLGTHSKSSHGKWIRDLYPVLVIHLYPIFPLKPLLIFHRRESRLPQLASPSWSTPVILTIRIPQLRKEVTSFFFVISKFFSSLVYFAQITLLVQDNDLSKNWFVHVIIQ